MLDIAINTTLKPPIVQRISHDIKNDENKTTDVLVQ